MKTQTNVGLTFSNYNHAFGKFYEHYKNLCIAISDKTFLNQIEDIRKITSTFIYDYDYTLKEKKKKIMYREELETIKNIFQADQEVKNIINKDFSILKNRIQYYRKYYLYFLSYLRLIGNFSMELTTTFMPHTNLQVKLIKYSNNQIFFEKFTEHKAIVLESLSDFKIKEFSKCYNKLITFYYAYMLFINKEDRIIIDKLFSIILSIYLNKDNLMLLDDSLMTQNRMQQLKKNEEILHNAILFCNSKMNSSFSNYDVLPKLQSKIYIDKTLI